MISLVAIVALASAACDRSALRLAEAASDSTVATERAMHERARQDTIVRSSPGYVIDSVLPVEEEIRRFQADLGEPPDGFAFGAASRSALVEAFMRAVERNDTTALARLVVNRKEFGYLVYPTSPNARPPYRQSPDVVWLQRAAGTNKGAGRLLGRFGGRPVGFVGYACPSPPMRQGENAVWEGCVVNRGVAGGDAVSLRMFGPIIERGGRYKFLSLANGL